MKETIGFEDFLKIDIRVGTIISAIVNEKAKKAAYVLEIDFGNKIGLKTSSAQITENYDLEELVGMQILAVVNFVAKRVAGVKSEVLVLAVVDDANGTTLLRVDGKVENGMSVL
jgi:tRNA-binding protein